MSRIRTELKWAFLFIGMMLLWMVIERLAGLHDEHIGHHAVYTNLVAIPAILIYCLALREKRAKDYGGTMTYKQGFLAGAVITLIVTVFTPLAQYITHTLITPDYFANVSAYAVAEGQMTEAEAAEYFSLGNYIVQATVGAFVMGLVTSAIVAFFFRGPSR